MDNINSKTRVKVHKIIDEWSEKWEVYNQIFYEMDKRRITLKEICIIAEGFGIPAGVVEMRRRDLIKMKCTNVQKNV
tara:strand:+ start:827 stop:1057 length:231 start_codon:yes stop_codon:yes gene_type:complete